jgi:capsid protein
MLGWVRSLVGRTPAAKAPAGLATAFLSGLRAGYDNALTTPENKRDWWNVDFLSAKAANSYQVRRTLRLRSRYEVSNNPFLFGVANNNADDLVGPSGPTLKVLTKDATYNRLVEASWAEWWAEVVGVEKLRTCKLAKTVDGEGFLILKTVRDLEHPVKLYPVDVEADQVTTPAPNDMGELWLDGVCCTRSPAGRSCTRSSSNTPGTSTSPTSTRWRSSRIPAKWVIHWFPKFRPGQVRGVPVFTPSLDLFAELRAYRRAVLGAAEIAADFAALLQQDKANGVVGGRRGHRVPAVQEGGDRAEADDAAPGRHRPAAQGRSTRRPPTRCSRKSAWGRRSGRWRTRSTSPSAPRRSSTSARRSSTSSTTAPVSRSSGGTATAS